LQKESSLKVSCYYLDEVKSPHVAETKWAVFLVSPFVLNSLFPCAEFGEELVLQRTPQTLTLVGELEDDFDEDEDDSLDDDDETADDEEEVEVLLSFEHRDKQYTLVRLLDPVLIVGKADASMPDNRILLTPEESSSVMPVLVSVVGAS
jgi:hypothetical protein